jgi:hypothetical protein
MTKPKVREAVPILASLGTTAWRFGLTSAISIFCERVRREHQDIESPSKSATQSVD